MPLNSILIIKASSTLSGTLRSTSMYCTVVVSFGIVPNSQLFFVLTRYSWQDGKSLSSIVDFNPSAPRMVSAVWHKVQVYWNTSALDARKLTSSESAASLQDSNTVLR